MKIVSVTMVNNESEIIESFIRYHSNIFDNIIIIDNGCTDNTIKIVRLLSLELQCNIIVFDESLESYEQKKIENKYVDYAMNQLQADIVIPLDADEFITAEKNPREILEQLNLNKIYNINWKWYVLTGDEDFNENYIPKRLKYRLIKTPWEYSTGKPVTKVILPSSYYKRNNLRLSMGHHFVTGDKDFDMEYRNDIKLAHYRIVSPEQVKYKSLCYSIRDISTMSLNDETAQRTTQVARLADNSNDILKEAIRESYCGYDSDIVSDPINMAFCDLETTVIKFAYLSKESIVRRVTDVSREMAIRTYNLELAQEKAKDKVLFWLDGVKGDSILFPSPSKVLERKSKLYNTLGYVTDCDEVSFLKHNFRLIVPIKFSKFIPHTFIVVTDEKNIKSIKNKLKIEGVEENKVISISDFETKIGIKRILYKLRFWGRRGRRFIRKIIAKIFKEDMK